MRVRCIAAFIGVSPATVSLAPQNKLKNPHRHAEESVKRRWIDGPSLRAN
jgi:hypothetical protein